MSNQSPLNLTNKLDKHLVEAQQAHDAHAQNTHSKVTMCSVVSVQSLLLKNHGNGLVDEPLHTIVSDMINHGIIAETEFDAYKDRLKQISETANSQFDNVDYFDAESQSTQTQTFSLKELMSVLITALYDDKKFIHPEYDLKSRLRAFHGVIDEIFDNQCSAGIRNLLIKRLLHDEYQNVFIIDEILTSLTRLTQRYYAEKLALLPEHEEFMIYNQFIRANQLNHPIETPALDELFDNEEPLRAYLEDCLHARGIKVSGNKKVSEGITKMLSIRFYIPPPMPREKQSALAALAQYWEQKDSFPRSVHQCFARCKTLNDIDNTNFIALMRILPIQEKAEKYRRITPFNGEESHLQQTASDIAKQLNEMLANPQHDFETVLIDSSHRLSQAIADYRKLTPTIITNAFALLNTTQNLGGMWMLFSTIIKTYTETCETMSDKALRHWMQEHVTIDRSIVTVPDDHGSLKAISRQTHTVVCTPNSVNQFILQALTQLPTTWSKTFKHLLRTVVIPLISKSNDRLHAEVIDSSYPPVIAIYLQHLLSIADSDVTKLPAYFIELSLNWVRLLLYFPHDSESDRDFIEEFFEDNYISILCAPKLATQNSVDIFCKLMKTLPVHEKIDLICTQHDTLSEFDSILFIFSLLKDNSHLDFIGCYAELFEHAIITPQILEFVKPEFRLQLALKGKFHYLHLTDVLTYLSEGDRLTFAKKHVRVIRPFMAIFNSFISLLSEDAILEIIKDDDFTNEINRVDQLLSLADNVSSVNRIAVFTCKHSAKYTSSDLEEVYQKLHEKDYYLFSLWLRDNQHSKDSLLWVIDFLTIKSKLCCKFPFSKTILII